MTGTARQPDELRLVIALNHRGFVEALTERLEAETDLRIVASTTDPARIEVVLRVVRVDVLLVDWAIGLPDPRTELARLRAIAPGLRVVAVADDDGATRAEDVVRAGVDAWVRKGDPVDRLCDAVRGVTRGEMWFPPTFVSAAVRSLIRTEDERSESKALVNTLTPREFDVLRCLVGGLSRDDIAQALYISPNTVRTHVNNLLHRLGVHDSVAAVAIARRAGVEPFGDTPALPNPT